MKKWTTLLLVLAMLLGIAGSFGETAGTPDLYDLYEKTENGKEWISTVIPIMESVAITSSAGISLPMTAPVIWDGTAYRAVTMALPTADGTVLVLLHETDGETPGIPAFSLLENGRVLEAGELTVRSGDWMKSRINRAVYDLSSITWKNQEALLLTLSGETSVGAPLIASDGKLAGMIVAEYAEGVNRYVALPVNGISNCLQEAYYMTLGTQTADTRPEGYTVTMDQNLVTFDWSQVQLPETAEGETLFHVIADYDSAYFTYMEVSPGDTSLTMLLTPGRTYVSGLAVAAGTPADIPEEVAFTTLPEAEPLTGNQFNSLVFAIGEQAEGAAGTDLPTAIPETITEEFLRSGRACIYSVSTYTVETRSEETLLITLTAPDGSNYRYESGWIYDPSYMDHDEWATSLSMTTLLDMLNRTEYPEGTYELSMYIGGKLADSFHFELSK